MDASVLVLAAACVPLGGLALVDILSDRRTKGLFGVASSAWSASGVLLVYLGVPGVLFFPGLLVILASSHVLQGRAGEGRAEYVKAALLLLVLAVVSVGLVLL